MGSGILVVQCVESWEHDGISMFQHTYASFKYYIINGLFPMSLEKPEFGPRIFKSPHMCETASGLL